MSNDKDLGQDVDSTVDGLSEEDRAWLMGGRQSEVTVIQKNSESVPDDEESADLTAESVSSPVPEPVEESSSGAPDSSESAVWASSTDSSDPASSADSASSVDSPDSVDIFEDEVFRSKSAKSPDSPEPAATDVLATVGAATLDEEEVLSSKRALQFDLEFEKELAKLEDPPKVTRRSRRARLRLTRIDPWSVMKTTFMFSIAGAVIMIVAVWLLWSVINSSGVLEIVENAINDVTANPNSDQRFMFRDYINVGKILGLTTLIAAANVVIITALSTLFAFLYNLAGQVLGGLELTLSEE